MKLKEPKNSNYCATVVEISTLKPLENADRVLGAIIFGNQVIVSKETKVGDIGLYFPLETQLSKEFLSANNLYRKKELNIDDTKTGYFEENGRIRCVKFRGNKSEGFFIPLESVAFIQDDLSAFKIGDEFDEIIEIPICNKYVVKKRNTPGAPGSKKNKAAKKYESKLVDNQFRFHQDTSMLYKNMHRLKPDSLVSITYKLHGTSAISSRVLCKNKIYRGQKFSAGFCNWFLHPLINILGGKVGKATPVESDYGFLYSSRKVIKNEELNPNANHYYEEDVWGAADKELREFLEDGMTLYYEIVGQLPNGGMIQKDYDYGYPKDGKQFGIYIYRITYTNPKGKVFEFSAKQVQDWCHFRGLNPVPELFYGRISEISDERLNGRDWEDDLLEKLKERYNEKDCHMCDNKVPEEGCVIRIEGTDFEAYKLKSNRFYAKETKDLDKGESNIEDEN